jgi:hypothetical protein
LHIVPEHVYGAQSIALPLGVVSVCPSGPHEAPAAAKHWALATSQRKFVAQSESALHAVPHLVPAQTNGAHWTVIGAGQEPDPLQRAANIAVPFAHEASLQATSAPTSPTHAVVVTPSHAPALHAFVPVAARHAGRPLRGAPETALHLPMAPARLHAAH